MIWGLLLWTQYEVNTRFTVITKQGSNQNMLLQITGANLPHTHPLSLQ